MDDNTRQRAQEQPGGSNANTRYSINDSNAARRSYGTGNVERYRPAPLGSTSSGSRSLGAGYANYYQQQSMAQSTMAYPTDYGQDTRQTPNYGAYNPSLLYNMQPASGQSAVYDTSQQFPQRQAAGLQMMSTDVAAPYFPNEPTNTAAASSLQPQAASSNAPAVYQPSHTDQRVLQQGYTGSIASMSGIPQADAAESVVEQQEFVAPPVPSAMSVPDAAAQMTEAYAQYQNALKEVFANIVNGALQTASESLLGISEWLLTKVVELGLTGDEETLHQDRLKLWRDFNHAWLSLFQKQSDAFRSGLPLQRGQTYVSQEQLKKMGEDLVRLCNGIEGHGLVDYEYGVWEERIIDILMECLSLYEAGSADASTSGPHQIGASRPSRQASG